MLKNRSVAARGECEYRDTAQGILCDGRIVLYADCAAGYMNLYVLTFIQSPFTCRMIFFQSKAVSTLRNFLLYNVDKIEIDSKIKK